MIVTDLPVLCRSPISPGRSPFLERDERVGVKRLADYEFPEPASLC
jgi:hypothetical protein